MFGEKNLIPEMAQRCPFSPFFRFACTARTLKPDTAPGHTQRRAGETRFAQMRSRWGFGHPVSRPFPSFHRLRLRSPTDKCRRMLCFGVMLFTPREAVKLALR